MFHIRYHSLLYLQINLELNILKLKDMILDNYFYISIYLHKTYLFYFVFIFLRISSRIFFVFVMLYMICRLVIYFFRLFLFVLSFNVVISFVISRTVSPSCYYQLSFFFIRLTSPCFFFIYNIFIAFCSSIYIIALLN